MSHGEPIRTVSYPMSSLSLSAEELGFSPDALNAFLRARISGVEGTMQITRVLGGQSNPTFFVSYPSRRMVLRKRPSGPLLPSAHAVDREYRIMSVLGSTDVPVPKMLEYYPGDDVVGTPFYVMERIEGRVFGDCSLPGVSSADRRAMFFDMADTLVKLHKVDWRALGLSDYGREGNYFARQVNRWTKQWELSKTRELPDIDHLVRWLPANVPNIDSTTIAHGDFRIGNLIFHPTEPRVVGVLDWELSTLGHPLADLAFSALAWHLLPSEYMGIRGLDHRALGIPAEQDYLSHYYRQMPDAGEVTSFHIALSLFRLAVIFEGIAARVLNGVSSSADSAQMADMCTHVARHAMQTIEGTS